jgi:hypothetical protein
MYSHGTRTPEISPSSKDSMEPGYLAILFKFHPDFSYEVVASDPDEGFGNPLPNVPVSTSAP